MPTEPYFILCGAMKSGTTSLRKYLQQHDGIFMPDYEVHFFDLDENYRKGFEWYLSHFHQARSDQTIGEASPLYMYLEHVPGRLSNYSQEIKLIFILRNPVDRAYSHYWHEYKKLRESLTFESAIDKECLRIRRDFISNRNFSYTSRSKYCPQIRRYLQYFHLSQMFFIIYESFVKEPRSVMKRLFEFLEIDADAEIDTTPIHNQTDIPRHLGTKRALKYLFREDFPFYRHLRQIYRKINSRIGYPEMNHKTRHELNSIFRDDINALEELLSIDLSVWNG